MSHEIIPEEVPVKPEAIEEDVQEEEEEKLHLPFPNSRVVDRLRKHLAPGKQIKKQVKIELNQWLGKMVDKVGKKMDEHPYSYVDGGMLREALEPYDSIHEIEMEKERIIKQLESVKAACDVLISEVDRKFRK